ncbi:hypothetical protein DLJ53_02865 [Acuticoccus sediminis]|uniref:Uncharacterized protein n=1 Tax=Acuticoccus sediminis TaxID=2184697 RepID=A0A8B2P0H3_9HYPH|nr:hypothetical protein DLJ53_02865 [Acuticoccus sediminis]
MRLRVEIAVVRIEFALVRAFWLEVKLQAATEVDHSAFEGRFKSATRSSEDMLLTHLGTLGRARAFFRASTSRHRRRWLSGIAMLPTAAWALTPLLVLYLAEEFGRQHRRRPI